MDHPAVHIERLALPVSDTDISDLAKLLIDTVDSGSPVSFLATLTLPEAEAWWRKTFASSLPGARFIVARDRDGIVGTAQLHPSWAPNQPHRGDVVKLMVHRRRRREGLATRLMAALEEAAMEQGLSLLTLDTKRGTPAERFYRQLDWQCVGTIPNFALDPDGGAFHDTVVFYKDLG